MSKTNNDIHKKPLDTQLMQERLKGDTFPETAKFSRMTISGFSLTSCLTKPDKRKAKSSAARTFPAYMAISLWRGGGAASGIIIF